MNIFKEDIRLPSDFPVRIGKACIERPFSGDKVYHWHECLEITYVNSGSGFYEVNGITYPMSKDDVILFNNVEPHAWGCKQNEHMLVTVLIFNPSVIASGELDLFDNQYLKPFNQRGTAFSNKLDASRSETGQILQLIRDIEYEISGRMIGWKLMTKTKLLNILTLLIRHFTDSLKPSEELHTKASQLEVLKEVLEYIHKNFTRCIRLDELAFMAHMSPNYFSAFFKQTLSLSPVEYITKCRIAMAESLIKTTNRTLLDIATECGFNNMSNFYRAYKKIMGYTPRELKK
ncbi:MAG: AraC family transcriptional regulator [Clostridia bacterium]|nr:AraC family transcriptional regulator [Clostridia bacterium]